MLHLNKQCVLFGVTCQSFELESFSSWKPVSLTSVIMETVKCVMVGDEAIGKSSLLVAYLKCAISKEYIPTVYDNSSVKVTMNEKTINLGVWDTGGKKEYDRLRSFSYPSTDVFIVCFSLVRPASFHNIRSKWYPEISYNCPNTPIVLVGTKYDLLIPELEGHFISFYQAIKLKKEIGDLECSAFNQWGVKDIFEIAARAGLKPPKKKRSCIIL